MNGLNLKSTKICNIQVSLSSTQEAERVPRPVPQEAPEAGPPRRGRQGGLDAH